GFFTTLQNTYNFFALYANLDAFSFAEPAIPLAERTGIDHWIISRLNSLKQTVTAAYEAYEPTKASRAIQDFVVNDLSNWYVRLNRKRFWKGEQNQDKQAAYQTLYTCLVIVAQLASPIAPFYTERLYQDLNYVTQKEPAASVHLSDWPQAEASAIDTSLETKMYQAQTIVSLAHSLRKKHNIKVRQPLAKLIIPVSDASMKEQIASIEELILAEVNVKHIEYIADTTTIIAKKIKPDFKKLGQRYGTQVKAISHAISQLSQADIKELEKTQHLVLLVGEEHIHLTLEDVVITSEDMPGWSVATQGSTTIALDITINDALRKEGIARDLVNRIQNIRKDMGLAVQDKISIAIAPTERLVGEAIAQHQAYICQETQALQLVLAETVADGKVLDIDGYTLQVQVALQPARQHIIDQQ
ncbi:MAG: DUF5915 domain-containing protein, partial [Bacteroidota bacterium]